MGEATDREDSIARLRAELELIVRIDERTQVIAAQLQEVKNEMVRKSEFQPVRLLVYGMVAIMLSTVIAAVMSTAVIK